MHHDLPWRNDVVETGCTIDETTRTVTPNTRPGLGVKINEDDVKKPPFEQAIPKRVFNQDGSVGDW